MSAEFSRSPKGRLAGLIFWSRWLQLPIYLGLIVTTLGLMALGLAQRTPMHVNVLRDRAFLVRETNQGQLENAYQLKVFNADARPHRLQLQVAGLPGATVQTDPPQPLLPR